MQKFAVSIAKTEPIIELPKRIGFQQQHQLRVLELDASTDLFRQLQTDNRLQHLGSA